MNQVSLKNIFLYLSLGRGKYDFIPLYPVMVDNSRLRRDKPDVPKGEFFIELPRGHFMHKPPSGRISYESVFNDDLFEVLG